MGVSGELGPAGLLLRGQVPPLAGRLPTPTSIPHHLPLIIRARLPLSTTSGELCGIAAPFGLGALDL